MKVYCYPADVTGCGYYRLIWPALALKAQGHDVEIVSPQNQREQFKASMVRDHMVDIQVPPDADVIVLQRTTHRYLSQAVKLIQQKGVAVVIDMDDDLSSIDPAHPAWSLLHPKNSNYPDHSWENVVETCKRATLVTVSAPALLDVYGREHGRVLHNYVPQQFTQYEHYDSSVVGWAGAVQTHPRDIQELTVSLPKWLRAGIHFRVVGPHMGIVDVLAANVVPQISVTGGIDFQNWAAAINQLGVGLAPTADTRFNRSKSWLKPLEYAALGVPSVSSARVEYQRLRTLGIGNIAKNSTQWTRETLDLATNWRRRQEESARDRALVLQHLTIEANAWRWAEVWTEASKLVHKNPLGLQNTR